MQAGFTELVINENEKITEIGISCVLQTIITNKLNAFWCGASNLEMVSLARALAVNNTLEELAICFNYIGDEGIGHIGTALLTNTTLKILNIGKCVRAIPHLYTDTNSNHTDGRVRICTALQTNTTLKKLTVYF